MGGGKSLKKKNKQLSVQKKRSPHTHTHMLSICYHTKHCRNCVSVSEHIVLTLLHYCSVGIQHLHLGIILRLSAFPTS